MFIFAAAVGDNSLLESVLANNSIVPIGVEKPLCRCLRAVTSVAAT